MLHDIIITLRNGKIFLEGLTPKGDEWILMHTTDKAIQPELSKCVATAHSFKWEAEKAGLKVTLNT